ncbi:MAG TPA: D-2-hydroxyacid dehydrogenase [Burkholderiales bacterium]|nr:D-2-hydroxyacid dehydrogenase [Burkholderiales bacterium]
MTTLLVSHRCNTVYGAAIAAAAARAGPKLELLALPADCEARLADADCARIDLAYFSADVFPEFSRQFFSALRKAPGLKWLHVFNAGVDHPIYAEMLARGVRLTTSSGSTAEPIAQTAIAGLLMLARNFPRWLEGQRKRVWDPMRVPDVPRDLRGQTMLILGLGKIGNEIARLAQALGLHVIGLRRGGKQPGDHVDELRLPGALNELLPGADWLIVACPLTAETRGMIDAGLIARLPRGARIINIARGEIIDETALIAALREGRLGGAYLDVFGQEPLPAESPLWDLPNVFVSPHNSAAALGNDERVHRMFIANLENWQRGKALGNEVCSTP